VPLPCDLGVGSCQHLTFEADPLGFSPQTHKLFPLDHGQHVVAAAFVPMCLLVSVLARFRRGTELPAQLLRPATSPKELHDLLPLPRRIRRMGSRHCGLLSTSTKVSTQPVQLHLQVREARDLAVDLTSRRTTLDTGRRVPTAPVPDTLAS
jgi:hypothetical protein